MDLRIRVVVNFFLVGINLNVFSIDVCGKFCVIG